MTATTKLGLELLASSAANQLLANMTFAQLNQLVQSSVTDRASSPPGSPTNESLYIITATASGIWAGKEKQLAYWLTSTAAWQYIAPREGMLVHVNDEDLFYKYDGSSWVVFAANPMTAVADLIVGGSSGQQTRLPKGSPLQVLRVNAAGDALEWAAAASGGAGYAAVVTESTTDRTLALTDAGAYIRFTNSGSSTCTVDPQSSTSWAVDTEIHVRRAAAGSLTLTAGAGVTLNAPSGGTLVLSNNMSVTLKRVASDEWDVIGQTVPV